MNDKKEIEVLEGNIAKVELTVNAKEAQDAYNKALRKINSNINIAGFRRGKAPDSVVERYVGVERIQHQMIEDVFPRCFGAFMERNPLDYVEQPYIEDYDFEKGKDLKLTVRVELKPEFEIKDYKDSEIEFEEYKVKDEDFQKELNDLKENFKTTQKVENRKTEANDIVVFDFDGSANGKPIVGGSAKGYSLDLAHSNFIPGFAEGLIGHETGEEFTIDVTFPENYHSEELKGAKAEFKIKIHEIQEKIYPELNDEFASKATNGRIKTYTELEEDIKKYLSKVADMENKRRKETAVLNKLIENTEINIQKTMINREIEAIKAEMQQRASMQGVNWNDLVQKEGLEKVSKELEEEAIRRIKTTLIIEKIAKIEDVKIAQDDMIQEMNEIAMNYGGANSQIMEEFQKNPSSISLVAHQAISKKVIGLLVEKNTFKNKKGNE